MSLRSPRMRGVGRGMGVLGACRTYGTLAGGSYTFHVGLNRVYYPRRTYGALADGSYTFQVQALGAAGVSGSAGPAASSTFLVDTTPPVISGLLFTLAGGGAAAPTPGPATYPGPSPGPNPAPAPAGGAAVVLPSGAFTAAFDVTDGVLGSGVNGCAHCTKNKKRGEVLHHALMSFNRESLVGLPAQAAEGHAQGSLNTHSALCPHFIALLYCVQFQCLTCYAGCRRSWCRVQAVTDVSGTAVAGAQGRGADNVRQLCSPGGTAYSLDSGTYTFQARDAFPACDLHVLLQHHTSHVSHMRHAKPTCISVTLI